MNTEIHARPDGVAAPAFTLPDATTLGPVHLQVSDLTRSLFDSNGRVVDTATQDRIRTSVAGFAAFVDTQRRQVP